MRKKRAVSPSLAVIMLIGITIVGGVILNESVLQIIVPNLTQIEYKITDLKLQKNDLGSCYLTVEVYNSGIEIIEKLHLKTTLDSGEDWVKDFDDIDEGLGPGNSAKIFEQIPYTNDVVCGNFTVSNTYSFSINASSAESTANILQVLKVENVTQT